MEIVETIVDPIVEENGWRVNLGVKIIITLAILIGIFFLIQVFRYFLSRIDGEDVGFCVFISGISLVALFILGAAIGTGDYVVGETTTYRVRLDDTYPANALIEKYDIVDYKDGIWTIIEKGEQQ